MNTKLKLLTLALTGFFVLISCDTDDTPEIDENLFGTWTLDATILQNCRNSADNGTLAASCDDETCTTLIMTSDGRYERREIQDGEEVITEQGSLRIDEKDIFLYPDNNIRGQGFNLAMDENTLLLSVPSNTCFETFRFKK